MYIGETVLEICAFCPEGCVRTPGLKYFCGVFTRSEFCGYFLIYSLRVCAEFCPLVSMEYITYRRERYMVLSDICAQGADDGGWFICSF